ncbi:transcriptional adapter 1-like [Dysidea avara]|uniref:transcriptional adapter 1-like n=1 Tax=Dysidea avara TaxID=196820 RepID=UPI0033202A87
MALDVQEAKKSIAEALGDKASRYWELIKNWYRKKITKEDFDAKAKILLGSGNVCLHNNFMFAILIKCQTGLYQGGRNSVSSTQFTLSGKPKAKKRKYDSSLVSPREFSRANPFDGVAKAQPIMDQCLVLCSKDHVIPSVPILHVRMLINCWELGLETVPEETVLLMATAVEFLLKNVITAVIERRKTYKTGVKGFKHAFGHGAVPSKFVSVSAGGSSHTETPNRLHSSAVLSETDVAFSAAVNNDITTDRPIDLFELRNTLQFNQQVIPSHTVYATAMETILCTMWHPSHQDLDHMTAVSQWECKYKEKHLKNKPSVTT